MNWPLMIGLAMLAANADDIATSKDSDAAVPATAGKEDQQGFVKWELSYHVAISPFIKDYRRCLNYGNRIARGVPDMEMQYRADLPRCADARDEAVEASIDMIERRNLTQTMSVAEVERAFEVIGLIHVERGRNFDDQLVRRIQLLESYGAQPQPATPQSNETNRNTER